MKRMIKYVINAGTWLLVLLICLFTYDRAFLRQAFPGLAFEQVLYNLGQPLDGTPAGIIQNLVLNLIIMPVLISIPAWMAFQWAMKKAGKSLWKKAFIWMVVVFLVLASAYRFSGSIGLRQYVLALYSNGDFYSDNYKDPRLENFVFPEQKRNLIYLILESMEVSYADEENGGIMDPNLLPHLTQLAGEGTVFSSDHGMYTLSNTGWTATAIMAMASGVPVRYAVGNANTDETLLSGAYALGDILEQEGYSQMFIMGSDADFAGRRNFYVNHGDYEIRDVYWAKENGYIPEDYWVNWGYEDEILFDIARDSLNELSASQPFNLTLLTADTHFPDGYLCESCPNDQEDQYSSVIRCSDEMVYDFVKWCQEQEWWENTTMVICGDHDTMSESFAAKVPSGYQRSEYCLVLNPARSPQRSDDRTWTAMDMFPTTLSALGVEWSSDRLGVGTSLFGTGSTFIEDLGVEQFSSDLWAPSNYYLTRLASSLLE